MENIIFAFNCIAPLFITVFFGYFLKRRGAINKDFIDTASDFAFKYLFPLVMFKQIYNVDIRANLNVAFILYGVVGYAVVGLIVWFAVPRFIKDRPVCGAFMQGIYRSNCVLMGVALAGNAFGPEGSLSTVLLLPFVSVVQNIGAVTFLTVFSPEEKKLSVGRVLLNIIKNPIIIGALAGMAAAAVRLPVPLFLEKPMSDLAGMASTLALIALGGQIQLDNFFQNTRTVLIGCFIKLVVSPLVMLIPAALFFDFSNYEMGAIYFIFGSCTAVSSFIMAKSMKADETMAAQMVIYTTVLSSVTMFIWIFGMRQVGII